jgi:uncharacterized protein (TIGR02284 family)
MTTTIGGEGDALTLFANLVELEYDALEAYLAAVDRLGDAAIRATMQEFIADHRRHVSDLGSVIGEMGGSAPTEGDFKRLLTKGKVVIGQIAGDKGILQAMKTNEDDTNQAYERAAGRDDVTARGREVLERNLADERRHRAWIEAQIARM